MAEPNYYYNKNGQPTGPITVVQLKSLADSGQIKPTDLVWREGTPNWVAANTVKGLFGSVTPPMPAAPPPVPSRPVAAAAAAPPPAGSAAAPAPTAQPARPATSSRSEDAAAASEFARNAAQAARDASQQAWEAVKTLIADPVGGIGKVYDSLGPNRAMVVGATFMVAYLVCQAIANIIGPASALFGSIPGLENGRIRQVILGVISSCAMFATLVGLCALFRMRAKQARDWAADVLIVGIAMFPVGVALLAIALLFSILKPNWILSTLIFGVMIFAASFCIMLLFSGLIKIIHLSERLATLAVPAMLFAAYCVTALLGWVF